MPVGRVGRQILEDDEAADDDEGGQHGHLDGDDGVVELGPFRNADDEQDGKGGADQEGRQVEHVDDRRAVHEHVDPVLLQMVAQRPGQRRRDGKAEVSKQADDIARPADRDDRSGKPVFEQQEGAHHPGGELADRRVAVGVSRAGHRQSRGELGVAQAGESADDARDGVGDQDGRAGVKRGGVAGADENAGPDDAADTKKDEVPRAKRSLELAGPGFFLNLGHALAQHHPAENSPTWSGSRHTLSPKSGFAEPSGSTQEGNPPSASGSYRASIGPSGRPAKMWTWRCGTSWPES